MFSRSSSSVPAPSMPSAEAAELSAQMDLYTELFNRLTRSCSAKCLALKNTEGELSKGESVCLDRCARKYMDTNVAVGQAMAKMQAERDGGAAPGGGAGGFPGFS